MPTNGSKHPVTVIGAGPAGLMAAEVIATSGVPVQVVDHMPTAGRKFLVAGVGGLNLTHAEETARFVARYGDRAGAVSAWLEVFGPQALREWAHGLRVPTFVGSSGRVFPTDMKAAPLLRHWLSRLRHQGVIFRMRERWTGFDAQGAWRFEPTEPARSAPWMLPHDATVVLALGGASWRKLGSDGAWVPCLANRGLDIAPLQASNVGMDVQPAWSPWLRERHAGAALKNVALQVCDAQGSTVFEQLGECVLTDTGLEGQLIYAASSAIRLALRERGHAVWLDLLPQRDAAWVDAEVRRPRGARSLSTHLKARLHIEGAKAALLHEALGRDGMADLPRVARTLKRLPLPLAHPRPIDEAISTAGGIRLEALDDQLMCRCLPGVFAAGEMLDWDAPTGGYLMTAVMASARVAGRGAAAWWLSQSP